MKFGINEGMATKAGNFILGAVFVAVLMWAICVAIKGSSTADDSQQSRPQLRPSAAR